MKMGESIKQVDTLERFQTPNHWNNSIHSEAFTEQKSLREHGPGQHPNLDLSILSRQNQSVTSGVSTHGVPQKVPPTSHFGRKNKQQEGEQPKPATDKLSVLRGLLSTIESVQPNKKQLDGGSMATVVLDNSERPNNNNPSSLISGRSGQVHSTVSVPQTLQEKEMILKLVKLRTQKTQELKESKYFLLKSRLQQLNNSLVVLRDEEKKLGSHADKQIYGLGQSTIQEFGEESPVQSPEESERQMLELVAIVRKTSKSIEQLEEQLRLTTCKHALLQVQIGILEEGFLSPNLSGTKSNHTREVTDIKSDALTMIKSVSSDSN